MDLTPRSTLIKLDRIPKYKEVQIKTNGKVSKDVRSAYAKLLGNTNVSAHACSSIFAVSLGTNLSGNLTVSHNELTSTQTAIRSLVEGAICIKYNIAALCSESNDLAMGFDSTTKAFDRHFMEFHLSGCRLGVNNTIQKWRQLFALQETIKHDAISSTDTILKIINSLTNMQQELGIPQTKLYNFKSVCTDNENLNKGATNGIIALLNKERQLQWKKDHPTEPNIADMIAVGKTQSYCHNSTIGCSDHFVHLMSKEYHKRLGTLGYNWSLDVLEQPAHVTSFKNGAAWLAKREFKRVGQGPWKEPFASVTSKHYDSPIVLDKVTPVRYVSTDKMLYTIATHRELFLKWYEVHKHHLTEKDKQDYERYSIYCNLVI
jgi:hypothetical protein